MSLKFDLTERLLNSSRLSYFRKYDEFYIFHDLYGYILKMSADLVGFVTYFKEPRTFKDALDVFGQVYSDAQLLEFIEVFKAHGCLVNDPETETTPLWEMHPTYGSWIVFIDNDDGTLTHYYSKRDGETASDLLDLQQSTLWRGIDGEKTLRELVDELRAADADLPDDETIMGWLNSWTHSERQLLKFAPKPESYYQKQPHLRAPYLTSTMPYERFDPHSPIANDELPRVTAETMEHYHQELIKDAKKQFDVEETTLSHVFRIPHKALGGKTYAHRLADLLYEGGHLTDSSHTIWEVGGGTGMFALGMLNALRDHYPEVYAGLSYNILDLSPALQASQKEILAGFGAKISFHSGNAESFAFPAEAIDLVICNEMIGDLTAKSFTREQVGLAIEMPEEAPSEEDYQKLARAREDKVRELGPDGERILKYGLLLDDAPGIFWLNFGAYTLLEKLHAALKPRGAAVMIEFGDLFKYPALSSQLDHPEFSIHFGHLANVAKSLGFEVDYKELAKWMLVERELPALATTKTYYQTLAAALAERGIDFEKLAYTREMFEELLGDKLSLDRLHVLDFRPIDERTQGLVPFDFKALLVRKPTKASFDASQVLEL